MRGLKFVAGLTAMVALCGCDWSGTGDGGSWNDSYSWANFTGVYRSPSGGTIVNQNTNEPTTTTSDGTTSTTVAKTTEKFGSSRNGVLGRPPVAGSVSVVASGKTSDKFETPFTLTFTDDGSGTLVASDTTYGSNGSVNYSTGNWSVNWQGVTMTSVTVSYAYEVQGTAGASSKKGGSSGEMIYSFNVVQAGNKLTITDSNGTVYSGQITGANVPPDTTQAGSVRLPFEASAANGTKLVGAFNGDWSGADATTGQGTLSNRLLEGTYVGRTSASIYAVSGSVSLAAPVVSSNVPTVQSTP